MKPFRTKFGLLARHEGVDIVRQVGIPQTCRKEITAALFFANAAFAAWLGAIASVAISFGRRPSTLTLSVPIFLFAVSLFLSAVTHRLRQRIRSALLLVASEEVVRQVGTANSRASGALAFHIDRTLMAAEDGIVASLYLAIVSLAFPVVAPVFLMSAILVLARWVRLSCSINLPESSGVTEETDTGTPKDMRLASTQRNGSQRFAELHYFFLLLLAGTFLSINSSGDPHSSNMTTITPSLLVLLLGLRQYNRKVISILAYLHSTSVLREPLAGLLDSHK